MDPNNPLIQLCILGSQAEFAGRPAEAWARYEQAWGLARDDYEACIAAHYVARSHQNPSAVLYWNQEALRRAEASGDERTADFYPSLYLSLGKAYELSGNQAEAQHYYALAAGLGFAHQAEYPCDGRFTIDKGQAAVHCLSGFSISAQFFPII